MRISIDMVIPSYRLQETILLPIIQLPVPEDVDLSIFIIADNPRAVIPESILQLAAVNRIYLLVNKENMGFSASRNKGINAGNAEFVLLLDDDVVPQQNLLFAYRNAIQQDGDAFGFAGVTTFPAPFNAVTNALSISGTTHHFTMPSSATKLRWTPTANVLLKRTIGNHEWFDEGLRYGGEDIALLAGTSLKTGKFLRAVPDAVVTHPWWNNGKAQLKRMFRYGRAAAEILSNKTLRPYTWLDFTNTSESLFLLLLISPLFIYYRHADWLGWIAFALIAAEYFTCFFKTGHVSGNRLLIAWQLMLHKNARELGALIQTLKKGKIENLTRRLDVGFSKPHPSPYRLNRWKILKSCLVLGIILLIVAITATF